jgi:hypothetical protein
MHQQGRQIVELVPDIGALEFFVVRVNRESRAFAVALIRIFVVDPQGQCPARQSHACIIAVGVAGGEPVGEQLRGDADRGEIWVMHLVYSCHRRRTSAPQNELYAPILT